jgi:hypothetical protein
MLDNTSCIIMVAYVNYGLEGEWKGMVVTGRDLIRGIIPAFAWRTKENHEKSRSGLSVSLTRLKPWIFRIQVRSATAWSIAFNVHGGAVVSCPSSALILVYLTSIIAYWNPERLIHDV